MFTIDLTIQNSHNETILNWCVLHTTNQEISFKFVLWEAIQKKHKDDTYEPY